MDKKVLLSSLWLFALLNYLYCDIVGLMDTELLKQYLAGSISGIQITRGFLLGASILMEIPIAMVLLSRILNYRANRWANIVSASIMTIVQAATLIGTTTIYYLFFSIIEIASTIIIFMVALRWKLIEGEENGNI